MTLNHFNGLWLIIHCHICPTVWIIQRELLARANSPDQVATLGIIHPCRIIPWLFVWLSIFITQLIYLYEQCNYRIMIWRAFVIENGKNVNLQILGVMSTRSHANLMAVWRRLFSSAINLAFQTSHWSKCISCRMFPSQTVKVFLLVSVS